MWLVSVITKITKLRSTIYSLQKEEGWLTSRRKGILFTVIGALFSATASVSIKLAEQVRPYIIALN